MYELKNMYKKKNAINQKKINCGENVKWSEQFTAEFLKLKETLNVY